MQTIKRFKECKGDFDYADNCKPNLSKGYCNHCNQLAAILDFKSRVRMARVQSETKGVGIRQLPKISLPT